MSPDDLARILDELGQRLGPTGEYVFALAVRQVYIDALTATIFLLLALAPLLLLRRVLAWVAAGGSYGDRGYAAVIGALVYAFVLILAVVNAFLVIPDVLNPEFAALRSLLGSIGSGS